MSPGSAFGLQGTPGLAPREIFEKMSKKIDIFESFGTDVGWFGGDFGTVWGYFRDGFGPTLKSRKFEGPESKN